MSKQMDDPEFQAEWAAIHEDELYAAWNKAVRKEPFGKIAPLV